MKAGCLYPDFVVQRRELVVPLHELAKQNALLADNGIVLLHLARRAKHGEAAAGTRQAYVYGSMFTSVVLKRVWSGLVRFYR